MTKVELSKYAGTRFYNLSTRPGGQFRTIHCLTVYEVTENGTCKYSHEVLGCVANKAQWQLLKTMTEGVGYHIYRPTAENLTAEFLEANR